MVQDRTSQHKSHKTSSFGISFMAASTSGAIEASLMYPFEFVKTQLQLQSKVNVSALTEWINEFKSFSSLKNLHFFYYNSILL